MEGDSYKPNTYTIMQEGTGRHYRHRTNYIERYKATYETLSNDNKCNWGKGDIVQFGSAFHGSYRYDERWPGWFITDPEEYFQFLKNNCARSQTIPLYAHNEYAIILNRYRWVKEKYKTFRDYGTIIMMLTGRRAGHIRRYFVTSPWCFIVSHPYDKFSHPTFKNITMPLIEDVFDNDLEMFLKNIMEKFT